MSYQIRRAEIWAVGIEDRPGGVAEKLAALAGAKANLEFVLARRAPDRPGAGLLFVSPIRGAGQMKAAREACFAKNQIPACVRVEGPDRPALGARLTQALVEAGINLRGLSASAIGKRCVCFLTFDSDADARSAMRVLKKLK